MAEYHRAMREAFEEAFDRARAARERQAEEREAQDRIKQQLRLEEATDQLEKLGADRLRSSHEALEATAGRLEAAAQGKEKL